MAFLFLFPEGFFTFFRIKPTLGRPSKHITWLPSPIVPSPCGNDKKEVLSCRDVHGGPLEQPRRESHSVALLIVQSCSVLLGAAHDTISEGLFL